MSTATKTSGTSSISDRLPTIGPYVRAWMEHNLVHGEGDLYGRPYRLEPWMKAVVDRMYEYDPVTLERPVRRVLVGIGKGNAKTEFAAAVGLAEACGPVIPTHSNPTARQSANVPIGAASREQANLCYGAATAMVREGRLAPFWNPMQFEMRRVGGPGRIYRIAAEAGTNDGTLPTTFIADELHEWTGRKKRVHIVVGNSLAKRAGGLEFNITTAGDPDTSDLLFNLYEYGKKVRSGEIVDPSFLFVWFEADEDWDLSDPGELRNAIKQANPSSWMDPDRVAARFEVDRIPEHEFRRYHLNQWVTAGDSFLPAGEWLACETGETVTDGSDVVVAFDGSYNGDSTALIGCTLDDVPHVFEIAVWERPENVRDWRVPRSEVDAVVHDTFGTFNVAGFYGDLRLWEFYMDEWVDRYGEDIVQDFPQSRQRMGPATAKFYQAVMQRELTHDGSVTLNRHLANATTKQFPEGYVLKKDHPNRKIDAAVAAVMAHDRATAHKESPPFEPGAWLI